jgi:hypothetical protein
LLVVRLPPSIRYRRLHKQLGQLRSQIDLPANAFDWQRTMQCDPQTNVGPLIACSDEAVPQVLDLLVRRGFEHSSVMGSLSSGSARVRVDAIGLHG